MNKKRIKKWIKKHPRTFTISAAGITTIINYKVGIGVVGVLIILEVSERIGNYISKKADSHFALKRLETRLREERRKEIEEWHKKNTPHIELIKKGKKFYWKIKIPNKKIKYIPQRLGDRAENILTSVYDRMYLEKVKT